MAYFSKYAFLGYPIFLASSLTCKQGAQSLIQSSFCGFDYTIDYSIDYTVDTIDSLPLYKRVIMNTLIRVKYQNRFRLSVLRCARNEYGGLMPTQTTRRFVQRPGNGEFIY